MGKKKNRKFDFNVLWYFIQNGTFNTNAAHQIIITWLRRKGKSQPTLLTLLILTLYLLSSACPVSQRSELARPTRPASCECHSDRVLPPLLTNSHCHRHHTEIPLEEIRTVVELGGAGFLGDTIPHFSTVTRDDSGMRRAQMERKLKGKIRKTEGLRRSGGPGEVNRGRARIKQRKTC